jgi:hypothetical protein
MPDLSFIPTWLSYSVFTIVMLSILAWGMREIWNCVGVDEWDDGTKP